MDYKVKYEQALERCKKEFNFNNLAYSYEEIRQRLERVFPELKESDDERIRRELIRDIDIAMPIEIAQRYIAWLEKQGEQKSTDKVEPKFRIEEGKWYVCVKDLFDNYANKAFCKGDIYLSTQDGYLIPSNSNVPYNVVYPDPYFRNISEIGPSKMQRMVM